MGHRCCSRSVVACNQWRVAGNRLQITPRRVLYCQSVRIHAALLQKCNWYIACGTTIMEPGPLDYYHFPVDPSKATASICEIG